jgi:hypothetical protein
VSPAILMLIPALIAVESSGNVRAGHDRPHGPWGCLQIKECVLTDVNMSQGYVRFVRADCLVRKTSVAIFCQYVKRYSVPEFIGTDPTPKLAALLWHYGPEGMKNGDPDGYWPRVEAFL